MRSSTYSWLGGINFASVMLAPPIQFWLLRNSHGFLSFHRTCERSISWAFRMSRFESGISSSFVREKLSDSRYCMVSCQSSRFSGSISDSAESASSILVIVPSIRLEVTTSFMTYDWRKRSMFGTYFENEFNSPRWNDTDSSFFWRTGLLIIHMCCMWFGRKYWYWYHCLQFPASNCSIFIRSKIKFTLI